MGYSRSVLLLRRRYCQPLCLGLIPAAAAPPAVSAASQSPPVPFHFNSHASLVVRRPSLALHVHRDNKASFYCSRPPLFRSAGSVREDPGFCSQGFVLGRFPFLPLCPVFQPVTFPFETPNPQLPHPQQTAVSATAAALHHHPPPTLPIL